MKFFQTLTLCAFCLFGTAAGAATAQDLYQEGLGFYQSQNWQEAQGRWQKALELEPKNPLILFNLGLARLQLGEIGYAAALWRKAISIDPTLGEARRALRFLNEKHGPRLRTETGLFSSAMDAVTSYLSLPAWGLSALLGFFLTSWLWIGFIGRARRAHQSNQPSPSFPSRAVAASVGTLFFACALTFKYFDHRKTAGTVIAAEAFAKSSPSEQATDLFRIQEGSEVILKTTSGEWVQATLPGGLSGWLKKQTVIQTSGTPLW